MNSERLTLVLDPLEMQALRKAAKAELRRPRDQARHILRNVLLSQIVAEPPTCLPPLIEDTTTLVTGQ